jgi:hypothetical protein
MHLLTEYLSKVCIMRLASNDLQLGRFHLVKVLRHGATKKKNLQVVHQLLRVREVKLRTEYLSKQAAYRSSAPSR